MGGLLLGGRGKLTSAACRRKVIELLAEANAAGAGLVRACDVTCICLRTLKRWRREFKADGNGIDRRKGSTRKVAHRLSVEEGQRILLIATNLNTLICHQAWGTQILLYATGEQRQSLF